MSQSDDQTLENQNDDQEPDETEEGEQTTNQPSGEEDEFDFEVDEDRLSLYDKLDKANQERKSEVEKSGFISAAEEEDAGQEDTEGEGDPSDKDDTETDDKSTERTGEAKEPNLGEKVLTREEFEEVFKDIKIKTKIAGEEVEAPISEFVKATGLEKHYTRRLQELSRREQEILQNRKEETDEGSGEGPSEEEVEEKYNELYEESPFKAQQYLKQVETERAKAKADKGVARENRAVDDFKSAYPECTEQEWLKMNDPEFWKSHDDIVKLKDSGDIFTTLVTAYNRLQQTKVVSQAADERKTKPPVDKTARKKKGQVIRTSIKTTNAQPKKGKRFELEPASDYIKALQKQARQRMGIED